jgi:hypothetical protein
MAVVYRVEGPFSLRAFDRRDAFALLGYGGWTSVSNVINPLLVSFVAAVAHYVVPMSLVARSQIFPAALARTFFTCMSSLSREEARALGARFCCSDTAMRRSVRRR